MSTVFIVVLVLYIIQHNLIKIAHIKCPNSDLLLIYLTKSALRAILLSIMVDIMRFFISFSRLLMYRRRQERADGRDPFVQR